MPASRPRPKPPETCPVCGTDVPSNALACPECGADHETGWKPEATADGLDLPDEHFDYNEFVDREFGGKEKARLKPIWWFTAVVLLALLVWWTFLK